jgi:hypothetical protein
VKNGAVLQATAAKMMRTIPSRRCERESVINGNVAGNEMLALRCHRSPRPATS